MLSISSSARWGLSIRIRKPRSGSLRVIAD